MFSLSFCLRQHLSNVVPTAFGRRVRCIATKTAPLLARILSALYHGYSGRDNAFLLEQFDKAKALAVGERSVICLASLSLWQVFQ